MDAERAAIVEVFRAESEEILSDMEEALVALERTPDDAELVRLIFRGAHSLKGNAAIVGLEHIAGFAHELEDLLESLREEELEPTAELVTLLLEAVDALRAMVPDALEGADAIRAEHRALLDRLTEVVREGGAPAAGSGPSPTMDDAPSGPAAVGRNRARSRTLRVDADRLGELLNLTGQITIARGRVRQELLENQSADEVLEVHRESDRLYRELQERVMELRMVPIGPVFRQQIRAVRDLAASHGKEARLEIEGAEVEVDTTVVEHLYDPLTHLVRNALDHGIEPPDVRKERGKDRHGRITLRARHQGGSIVVEVEDDGAGLHTDRILERAKARGMITDAEIAGMTDQQAYRLIFEPGFSTREEVTDLSGRGVGLDVVRQNIEILRGSIAIDSREGEGTRITIRLPLTLAIIDGFSVSAGREVYVLPMDSIVECIAFPEEGHHRADGQGVLSLRGTPLPYFRLRKLFRLDGRPSKRESIVVVEHAGRRIGLVADGLLGHSQVVIKPLTGQLTDIPGISGCTIRGDGRVALILDVPAVVDRVVREEQERAEKNETALHPGRV